MGSLGKTFALALVALFLTLALFIPSLTNAQLTQSYGRGVYGANSDLNYCAFSITMYSPNDQTTYVNTMILKFNITWTTYPISHFPDVPPALNGYYAYSIDNGPFVEVISNQSANDVFYQRPKNNFTLNPSFSYLLDISNLEKGNHNIVINASLYQSTIYPPDHLYFNMTTSPYKFLAGEPTATPTVSLSAAPTPTVPEFSSWTIPLLLTIMVALAGLLVYHKKHKR
jgi:hypothetical protein